MVFIFRFQTFYNFDRFFFSRFFNHNRLKTSFKSRIFFYIFSVLIKCCCTDNLNFTSGKCRFQNICSINSPFCGTCPDKSMHFINNKNNITCLTNFIHNFFQTFFKFAAVFSTCNEKPHIKLNNFFTVKNIRNFRINNSYRKPFRNCSLSDPRLAD